MGKGFGEGGKSGGKGKAGEPKKPVTRSAHVAQRPVLLPQVETCVCVCVAGMPERTQEVCLRGKTERDTERRVVPFELLLCSVPAPRWASSCSNAGAYHGNGTGSRALA